jgi:hypothetical protein
VHDGADVAPAYALELTDGSATVGPQAAAIGFTAVNDAPVIVTNQLDIAEGESATVSSAHIAAIDADTPAHLLAWNVSGSSGGRFEYAAMPGVAITSFTQADVDSGLVRFVHDGNEAPPAYALTLSDGAAVVGPDAAAITFTHRDDAPVLAINAGASLAEGEAITITNAMLRGTDVDTAAHQLVIELTGSPAHGTLLLGGQALGAGETFTQADVDAGLLTYRHERAVGADAFTFQASDASSTLASASFTLVVSAAPAPPSVPAPQPAPPAPTVPAPVAPAPVEPEPGASPMNESPIAAAPQAGTDVTTSASQPQETRAAAPGESPARSAASAVHPIAMGPARPAETEDAGIRTLAGLAATPAPLATAEVASATNWSARVSAAPSSMPSLLLNFLREAQAADSGAPIATQLASGQPPRDALLELEAVRNRIEEQFEQSRSVVASTIAVSTGLSVGYVLWLVRGGLLLTSVLSALPAWQVVDPLPVLGTMRRAQDDPDADDDAIEDLFQRSRSRPHARTADADTAHYARERLPEEAEA